MYFRWNPSDWEPYKSVLNEKKIQSFKELDALLIGTLKEATERERNRDIGSL